MAEQKGEKAMQIGGVKDGQEDSGYTQTMRTDDFEKAVLSGTWLFENMRDMVLHQKSFRMEIKYNAEARSVKIETFAVKEFLSDGSSQEC